MIYRSQLNAKINRFEVFSPTDFLAAITQHIPDKGTQMVRYYGWYSKKMRGVRHRGLPRELAPHRPGLTPRSPLKLPSKSSLCLDCGPTSSRRPDPSHHHLPRCPCRRKTGETPQNISA